MSQRVCFTNARLRAGILAFRSCSRVNSKLIHLELVVGKELRPDRQLHAHLGVAEGTPEGGLVAGEGPGGRSPPRRF